VLSLDIMDDSGQHLSGYTHDIYKVRLDQQGNHLDTEKAKGKPFDSIAQTMVLELLKSLNSYRIG
jgi:hypothetical protein